MKISKIMGGYEATSFDSKKAIVKPLFTEVLAQTLENQISKECLGFIAAATGSSSQDCDNIAILAVARDLDLDKFDNLSLSVSLNMGAALAVFGVTDPEKLVVSLDFERIAQKIEI